MLCVHAIFTLSLCYEIMAKLIGSNDILAHNLMDEFIKHYSYTDKMWGVGFCNKNTFLNEKKIGN